MCYTFLVHTTMAYYSSYRNRRRFTRRRPLARRYRRFRRRVRRGVRRYAKRSMTRRKVADIASTKCKDNMVCLPLTGDLGTPGTIGEGAVIEGTFIFGSLFCPTARDSMWTEGEREVTRQQSRVFARGYKERINIVTNDATNWMWRRIVFTTKNRLWEAFPPGTVEKNYQGGTGTFQPGQVRAVWNFNPALGGAAAAAVNYSVFEGERGNDWLNFMNAKTNKKFITVLSDTTKKLEGMNNSPRQYHFNRWYEFNKNFTYNEKERGETKPSEDYQSKFSSMENGTMGDVYVLDLFNSANGTSSNQLSFQPHGTYYWHEK